MLAKPEPKEAGGRLIELRAENFKKLKAVRITPDRGIFQVSGVNEAGKSTVLDIIGAGFGGKSKFSAAPIRKGQREAELYLDLGAFKIKRRIWKKKGSDEIDHELIFEYADGTKPKYPQNVLNDLRGLAIADDPLHFSRIPGPERLELIKTLVPGFDFAANESARDRLFKDRTEVGRDRDRARGAVESIEVPGGKPVQPVDITALANELTEAHAHNNVLDQQSSRREQAEADIESSLDLIDRKRKTIQALQAEIASIESSVKAARAKLASAPPLPKPISTDAIEAKLASAEATNELARKFADRARLQAAFEDLEKRYDGMTAKIELLDESKLSAIAKAKLPIPGLTFGADDILVDDLPFANASTARRLMIATRLLMALKPDIRVLLIREGSLLDKAARKALDEIARENDFVVLMECVAETIDGDGVIIADGEIVEGADQ